MWQAEVLFRQGWHVQKFEDEDEAREWINRQIKVHKKSVNPVRKARGRHCVRLLRPELSPPLPPPASDRKPFDEVWEP